MRTPELEAAAAAPAKRNGWRNADQVRSARQTGPSATNPVWRDGDATKIGLVSEERATAAMVSVLAVRVALVIAC